MSKEHHILIGPGIDGRISILQKITGNWESKHGLIPHVLPIVWKDGEHFLPKLERIVKEIDEYTQRGEIVSLVGCSASGSAMLNAFIERKNVIHKVVNLDGFVRPGHAKGFRNFDVRSAQSIAFRESVFRFVEFEKTLTVVDRNKILTVRPLFGDELVPSDTVVIQGAINKTIPMGEHVISIALALIWYQPVIAFLKHDRP